MDGILNIRKEKGYTSHDVVAKLRGICRQKKIGHTGTLDPEAEGVLPVCLGSATKVCDLLTGWRKTYRAVLRLGVITDTQDMTGIILQEQKAELEEQEIKDAVLSFRGEYDQIPPMYSALKVNGKKLYELARKGQEVERKPRRVEIYSIAVETIDLKENTVTMTVECSKGTYIRTLCEDIGRKLGCGGAMQSLTRIQVGIFDYESSVLLSETEQRREEGRLEELLTPVDALFQEYPACHMKQEAERFVRNGNPVRPEQFLTEGSWDGQPEKIRVYGEEKRFLALYEWNGQKGLYQPYKMFLS